MAFSMIRATASRRNSGAGSSMKPGTSLAARLGEAFWISSKAKRLEAGICLVFARKSFNSLVGSFLPSLRVRWTIVSTAARSQFWPMPLALSMAASNSGRVSAPRAAAFGQALVAASFPSPIGPTATRVAIGSYGVLAIRIEDALTNNNRYRIFFIASY